LGKLGPLITPIVKKLFENTVSESINKVTERTKQQRFFALLSPKLSYSF